MQQLQAITAELGAVRQAQATAENRVREFEAQLSSGRLDGGGKGAGGTHFDVRALNKRFGHV